MRFKWYTTAALLFAMIEASNGALAQVAGGGADYNTSDRAASSREVERQRLDAVDPPIQKDPLGNALIGGGVTGIMKGAGAGAASVVKGTALGTAVEAAKEKSK